MSVQKFIIVCLQSQTLSHSRMFEWCTRFNSGRQSVSDGDLACEQHSADSNKILRLHSDWQTCNHSYEI